MVTTSRWSCVHGWEGGFILTSFKNSIRGQSELFFTLLWWKEMIFAFCQAKMYMYSTSSSFVPPRGSKLSTPRMNICVHSKHLPVFTDLFICLYIYIFVKAWISLSILHFDAPLKDISPPTCVVFAMQADIEMQM